MPTGIANLASQTGETIWIDFSAPYSPATPGSSAWSVRARNIQFTVTVPHNLPMPFWFMAQLFPSAGLLMAGGAAGAIAGTRLNALLSQRKDVLGRVFASFVIAAGLYVSGRGLVTFLA